MKRLLAYLARNPFVKGMACAAFLVIAMVLIIWSMSWLVHSLPWPEGRP